MTHSNCGTRAAASLKLAVVALAGALLCSAGQAQAETLRVSNEGGYPPFNYVTSSGELEGFDVDLANALCAEMQVECKFVIQEWSGMIPALLANKFDVVIGSMGITEERKQKVAFTDKYYSSKGRFVMAMGSDTTDTGPDTMAGKTIGVQAATIHQNFLNDNYGAASIRTYESNDEALSDLSAGRIDAVFADQLVLWKWLEKSGAGCCEFKGESYDDPRWFGEGVGMAVRQEDEELRERLNVALQAIIDDGTYDTINAKYFPFSIY